MKKILLFVCALICSAAMSATTWNVTVPEGTKACYIIGEATGWKHTEMTKVDDTHYKITIETDKVDKYKYCSGPDWAWEEQTAEGGYVADRTYSENDVVAKWKAVWDPEATVSYVDITIRVKAATAPTIWWWGAGDKCPNPDQMGLGYDSDTNQPVMTAVEGKEGWYEWNFKNVNESLGVTFKLNMQDKAINAKASGCYNTSGDIIDCDSDEPATPKVQLAGDFETTDWSIYDLTISEDKLTASVVLTLEKRETEQDQYSFKMMVDGEWLGNGWYMDRSNCTGWKFEKDKGNANLRTDVAGDYTFTWTYATNSLSVTYPSKTPTDLSSTEAEVVTTKVIRNGQVLIIRDGVVYNMMGQAIR